MASRCATPQPLTCEQRRVSQRPLPGPQRRPRALQHLHNRQRPGRGGGGCSGGVGAHQGTGGGCRGPSDRRTARAAPHTQIRVPAPEPRPGPGTDAASALASVSCRGTGGAARGSARGIPSGRSSSLRFRGRAGGSRGGEKTSTLPYSCTRMPGTHCLGTCTYTGTYTSCRSLVRHESSHAYRHLESWTIIAPFRACLLARASPQSLSALQCTAN